MMRLFLFLGLLLSGLTQAQEALWIDVEPSLIGQNTDVRVSGLFGGEDITLDLQRPDATIVSFDATADQFGIAQDAIYGVHLEKAGTYSLNVFRASGVTKQYDFSMKAGPVSAYRSTVAVSPPTVRADGKAAAEVEISLRDSYGNVIGGEDVQLVSSRNTELITMPKRTDSAGKAVGTVKSTAAGVSTLTALAGGVVLQSKAEIVFYTASTELPNTGQSDSGSLGDFLSAQLFGDDLANPDVSYFRVALDDITVPAGEAQNVQVSAMDINGDIIPSYLGTVRFTSSDDTASLPQDYTFTNGDQGAHTFFLGATFNTAGEHSLAVSDIDDFRIFGRWEGTVVGEEIITPDPQPDEDKFIRILTPKEGTYKSNRMTITGSSRGCGSTTIRDESKVLIENLTIDADGGYLFQTPRLADGLHSFQATCDQDEAVVSEIVQIRIDRTPPAAMSVEVRPTNPMTPGQPFEIILGSSEPLSGGTCVFREVPNPHDAVADDFVGQYTAPLNPGEYPVSCSVFDASNNELEEPNAAVIIVVDPDEQGTGDTDLGDLPTIPTLPIGGSDDPFDPNGDADGDGIRNKDEWKDDNGNDIPDSQENRNVNEPRDTDEDGLLDDDERDIWGTDPLDPDTDRGGITDGVEIFFLGTNHLDAQSPRNEASLAENGGLEMTKEERIYREALLGLVSPAPFEKVNDSDNDGVPDWLERGGDKLDPTNDSDGDGEPNNTDLAPLRPTVEAPLKETEEDPSAVSNVVTECFAGDESRLWVRWAPARSNVGIKNYVVDFGTDPRSLTNQNVTPDSRTKWYIENLKKDQVYMVRITPVNQNGDLGAPEFTEGTPGCFTPLPPVVELPPSVPVTGSETPFSNIWPFLFGLLSAAGIFLFLQKKPESIL